MVPVIPAPILEIFFDEAEIPSLIPSLNPSFNALEIFFFKAAIITAAVARAAGPKLSIVPFNWLNALLIFPVVPKTSSLIVLSDFIVSSWLTSSTASGPSSLTVFIAWL